jgi:poly(A) polymerase
MKNNIRQHAVDIVHELKQKGFETYFVGGCVRDFIRGVKPDDYDIVTSAHPEQVMKIFPHTVAVGAKFGVVAVIVDGHPYEVATFRSDDIYIDGRRPTQVHFSSAKEDVLRRDFTINGLLMDPETEKIIDYVQGAADIEKKIIRTIGDSDARFREDHLRMLRAVRFAANLDFDLDTAAKKAIRKNAIEIDKISSERLREEITKILTRGGSRRGFELLAQTGLLWEILPEVERLQGVEQPPRFHPEGDVWQHTLKMLELLPQRDSFANQQRLAWGALLHDVGKSDTRTEDEGGVHFYGHVHQGEETAEEVMQRLRFSNADRETVIALIHYHMVFMNVQKMRSGRLKRFLRMPEFDLHLELHRLDCLASHGMLDNYDFCRQKLEHLTEEELRPPRLITGDDLITMGFLPGKKISEILHKVENAQLEGLIKTSEDAKKFVLEKWRQGGC